MSEIPAPIRQVTVLEDRAQVRRVATVALAAGSQRLRVLDVSPAIADRTVVARLDTGRVDEVRVVRTWRIGTEEQPVDAAALAKERESLGLEVDRRRARVDRLQKKRDAYDQGADLLVDGVQRELPFSASWNTAWGEDLTAFQRSARELDEQISAGRLELRDAELRLAAAGMREAAAARPDHLLATALEIDVTADAAGEAQLTVDYLVPCALWRPIHRASLQGSVLTFDVEGAVWQRTGEDWTDVEILFSTARPTQRSEPPVLHDDLLAVRRKVDRKIVAEVREQAIATTGEGMAAAATVNAAPSGAAAGELPGVDDGGETRVLPGAGRVTIPSDGRMRRIPILSFTTAADVDRLARPERSAQVHRRSRQPNASKSPILAGPVELVVDGVFSGRTSVGFIAPGERFPLGFGGDPHLRAERRTDEHRETGKILGKQTIDRKVELYLSNLDDRPARFALEERVPVSEIEAVTIEIQRKETVPPAVADEQGIVRWDISLPALGTQKVTLVYRIVAGSDVSGL